MAEAPVEPAQKWLPGQENPLPVSHLRNSCHAPAGACLFSLAVISLRISWVAQHLDRLAVQGKLPPFCGLLEIIPIRPARALLARGQMQIPTAHPDPRRFLLSLVQPMAQPGAQARERINAHRFHTEILGNTHRPSLLTCASKTALLSLLFRVLQNGNQAKTPVGTEERMVRHDAAFIPYPLKGDGNSRSDC